MNTYIYDKCNSCPTIIAVDDENINQYLYKKLFESIPNINYGIFGGAEYCYNYLNSSNVDILIFFLDIAMPIINGFDMIKTLRGSDRYNNSKIIFSSAFTSQDVKDRAYTLGCDDFFEKPFNLKKMVEYINSRIILVHS